MKKEVIFWIALPATAYPCILPCMEAGLFPDIVFIVLDEVNYLIVGTVMVSAALVIFVSSLLTVFTFFNRDITLLFILSLSTYIALSRHDLEKKK
jgi:hypothetical protein